MTAITVTVSGPPGETLRTVSNELFAVLRALGVNVAFEGGVIEPPRPVVTRAQRLMRLAPQITLHQTEIKPPKGVKHPNYVRLQSTIEKLRRHRRLCDLEAGQALLKEIADGKHEGVALQEFLSLCIKRNVYDFARQCLEQ